MRGRCTRERERGMTLILVALCIFVFIGIAALAVDVGVLYTARTSAQHAADAGALAGAYVFVNPPPGGISSGYIQGVAANVANQNYVLGTPAGITTGNVIVDMGNRRVTVTVPRTGSNAIPLFFARIFGLTTSDVAATATAEASLSPTGGRCIKPIFIPNTALSPETTAATACKDTPPQIMLDPTTHNASAWLNTLPPCPAPPTQPSSPCNPGSPISLKPNSPPGALDPSQYYTLDLGSGANTYQCVWSYCMSNPACGADQSLLQCGSSYPVKTGNMVGPTQQGVDGLICGPSGNCNTNPQDQWQGIGDYYNPSTGMISTDSRSLTIAPVWDDCSNPIMPGTNGQVAQVVGFVEIFVDGTSGSNVVGHVVSVLGCGPSGSTGTGPFATPVRLVQVPPAS